MSNYNLGTRPNEAEMHAAGIAYIVIPADVDRARYIKECYRTATVSIYTPHNGWSNRVSIDKHSLNFIKFPERVNEFGSAVLFQVEAIDKRPIITGIYFTQDEICDLVENQFKFKRVLGNNIVEITGSPEGKYLSLNVIAETDGEIALKVKSNDNSAKVTIDVDGEVEITASTETNIKQFKRFEVSTVDPENAENFAAFEQTNDTHIFVDKRHSVHTEKLAINDGTEPFILGQTFKTLFDEFIDELGRITTTTALGQMPILNKAQVTAFKKRTDTILSKVGFIDK